MEVETLLKIYWERKKYLPHWEEEEKEDDHEVEDDEEEEDDDKYDDDDEYDDDDDSVLSVIVCYLASNNPENVSKFSCYLSTYRMWTFSRHLSLAFKDIYSFTR